MHAQHVGTCVACGGSYSVGDQIEQNGMDDMGTPKQRWRFLHADCARIARTEPS